MVYLFHEPETTGTIDISQIDDIVLAIQALDGDMQMLVYENYNKFISATETIKRMKNNVDAMDGDMEAVRLVF